jgi:hypothetical protein
MKLDRRLTASRPDLADEKLRGQVEAERFTAGTVMQVVEAAVNLHQRPSHDSLIDTQAIYGEAITVFEEFEGWAWGQLHSDGYVGYVPSVALAQPGPAATHRVSALRTFVYPGPSLKLPYMTYLPMNAQVSVDGSEGDYARLATGGFVFAAHLCELSRMEPDFVAVAERFLHAPYLWGGKSSLGLDCSGLVQTALSASGVAAPRDTDMQEAALGTPVPVTPELAGLKRGDLVFWKGHVGVMSDPTALLHATGFTMNVCKEPLKGVEERVRNTGAGPITSIRRL